VREVHEEKMTKPDGLAVKKEGRKERAQRNVIQY